MQQFIALPKLQKGDQVAVISPSAGLPGLFPWVQDLGLERLRDVFGLTPKEYPTTRQMGSSLQDRARDIMAAFADPQNMAVFSSIGGGDGIMLIKYLDPAVFLANPKPFFGFSDNTHLVNFLWSLGIPAYYGGAIMTQFGMQGDMHELTSSSLQHALFDEGEFPLEVSTQYNDIGLDWADKESLAKPRQMEPNNGLVWDGTTDAQGILWGGCVESLIVQSTANKYLPSNKDLEGTVLCIETAEDIPDPWVIEYLLMGYGERGWLDIFQAVLVGRPKAWDFGNQKDTAAKTAYRQAQQETVLKTIRAYNKVIPVVQNLDLGHTDPQTAMPFGRLARLSADDKKIYLTY